MLSRVVALTAIYIGGALSTTLTGEAKAMMEDSMAWMDNFFDPKENLIFEVQSDAAMNHETLESVWYAVGLLARNGNQGQDVSHAEGIITRVIDDQYKDPADIWFGVYTKEPEEPYVGTAPYPATRYGSWDPNWYDFVGTAFVTIYEEFGPILSASTKEYMLESMVNSSIGNSRRGGDVDGDNLWPAYSNPAIMRAATTTWTGVKTGNKTMQAEGEGYAQQIIDLWDLHKTLSEFNSPTYTGISLFGLTLWGKYMPKSSILAQRGPDIFRGTFSTVAQLWHAGMRNLAGPWDRSYSFNMQTSLGHLSLLLAPIIGREESGLRQNPWIMSHARDWCWASLIAVHAEYFTSLVPQNVKKMLKEFSPHTWRGQVYYPPFDLETRNITTWLGEKLMIGAQSYHTTSSNGPDDNNEQFHPAVAQWTYNNGDIGWLDLRASVPHLLVDVSPNRLNLTYPDGDASSVFTFYASPSLLQRNVQGWSDIQGVNISISGNVDPNATVKFAGRFGGSYGPYYDYNYWYLQHTMPAGFEGTPELVIDFTY